MKRTALLLALLLLAGGCRSLFWTDRRERVVDVDGSSDHRIFRIGALTRFMLEPVFWRLEDTRQIDFDRPVTTYVRDPLPDEFKGVTLRMLKENAVSLPSSLATSWSLEDAVDTLSRRAIGLSPSVRYDSRRQFLRALFEPRIRRNLGGEPSHELSDVGFTLLVIAITDHLNTTVEALVHQHLVVPYGLHDTSFAVRPGTQARQMPLAAGGEPWLYPSGVAVPAPRETVVGHYAYGLHASAADILKVAYVVRPHLARVRGLFTPLEVPRPFRAPRRLQALSTRVAGASAYLAIDSDEGHAFLFLENASVDLTDEAVEQIRDFYLASHTSPRV